MTDDSNPDGTRDGTDYSRRRYLATAGTLGVAGTIGTDGATGTDALGPGPIDGGRETAHARERGSNADQSQGPVSEDRTDFLWVGGGLWRDEAVRENLFAFARRHDLAVVLVHTRSPERTDPEAVRPPMEAASAFDLDVWLNVGLLHDVPAGRFVTDPAARNAHLEWLRSVARLHGELFDAGRVVLWQEAPVIGQWVDGGEWNQAAVENLREHGPAIFAAQKRAIAAANDDLDVGLFVHFPYVVDSKRPDVFPELIDGIRATDVEPDFGFFDFYRGWYEKDVGPEPANAAVHSLVANGRSALDDRPVFYLGQSHTINPRHTPSKQAMRMNLRTSLDAGASGVGWYVRSRYVPTESGFDPFVPNVAGADVDSDAEYTLTVARDRFLYPWLATLESRNGFDAGDAFDLWLLGDAFGLYDHRLSLRTAAGEWEYVGDFGGYADGDFPEGSDVTHRSTIFRALDRDRYLENGTLECRIETGDDAAGATLQSVIAMPCDPAAYVSEHDAIEFVRRGAPVDTFSLGWNGDDRPLVPGTSQSMTIPVAPSVEQSLHALTNPDSLDTLRWLASIEDRADGYPDGRFDLWVSGTGLGGSSAGQFPNDPSSVDRVAVVPSLVDREGRTRDPASEGVIAAADALVICHGLARDRFLDDGLELAHDPDPSIAACYAMPAVGSATFRSPDRAATLLDEQPDETELFSLDSVVLQ